MVIALGLVASVIVVLMAFTIKRGNILKLSVAMSGVTSVQYALLGEWGTVWLTFVAGIYAVGLMSANKFPVLQGKGIAYALLVVYSVGFFGINGLSLSWPLLAYAASLLGTFMLLIHDPLILKHLMLINGVMWLAFQLISGAHGQLPGEIVYLVGVVFSILFLSHAKRKGQNLHNVPEFTDILKKRLVPTPA